MRRLKQKLKAKVQKADAEAAVARAASAASAASAAAADGHSFMKGYAVAFGGIVASEAQATKGKMKKILNLHTRTEVNCEE